MSEVIKIVAPTNNVNDTSVVVFQFLVEDGTEVKEGQEIIAVETSKATTNIESPAKGYIKFVVNVGDEIPNGDLLAVVAKTKKLLDEFNINGRRDSKEVASEVKSHVTGFVVNKNSCSFGTFDKPVTLGEVFARNGDRVKKGDILCRVRSGKGIESIAAPEDGFVHWNEEPYKVIKAGSSAGTIDDSPVTGAIDKDTVSYDSLRISGEAKQILADRKLSASDLGLTGLVTAKMVRAELGSNHTKEHSVRETVKSVPVVYSSDGRTEKLSKAKRAEASFLSDANRDAVISQVSVLVPTGGIFSACAEDPELAGKFSSTILFETGRLLMSYRQMCSIYDDGQLYVYNSINIGYAISIDDGLKVPVFKNADKKDLNSIISEKEQFIQKYISRELTPDDLGGGTFTITDLSSTGCYLFNPVLNLGQSAILGIGGENPEKTNYPLILAYDHRVIDGATATEFLNKLKERLIVHESVLLGMAGINTDDDPKIIRTDISNADPACNSCYRSIDEVEELGQYLFKITDKNGMEKHICSMCMRGW